MAHIETKMKIYVSSRKYTEMEDITPLYPEIESALKWFNEATGVEWVVYRTSSRWEPRFEMEIGSMTTKKLEETCYKVGKLGVSLSWKEGKLLTSGSEIVIAFKSIPESKQQMYNITVKSEQIGIL